MRKFEIQFTPKKVRIPTLLHKLTNNKEPAHFWTLRGNRICN